MERNSIFHNWVLNSKVKRKDKEKKRRISMELICGDCLEEMKKIPDNTIDLIITSPPYNKVGIRNGNKTNGKRWNNCGGNINYLSYDDNMKEEDYEKWQIEVLNECYRILKPTGSMFYNHKNRRYNGKCFFPEWCFKSKLTFYQMITWNRKNNVDANINYLNPTTELIFWFVKDKPKVFKSNAFYKSEVWEITPKPFKGHPAPFPIEIPENCICLTTVENDMVLDPFMGSGTSGIASKRLNRNFIGIEIDKNYFDMSKKRIEQTTKQTSIFDYLESKGE